MMVMFRNKLLFAVIAASALSCVFPKAAFAQTVEHVIHISVDGLRPDAVMSLGPAHCPNFHMLMVEGAFTLNARSDCDYTNTLPNHACQMTGRAVLGPDGHGVSFNSDTGGTIEDAHGSYVAGIFDVAHDNGLVTALFTGKDKFALFERSWDEANGAPDITDQDNGRDKIDDYLYLGNTSDLVDSFLLILDSARPGYSLLHLRDPDSDGHAYGWESLEYLDSIKRMDAAIGRVLDAVESDPVLSGRTSLIVTADHGGTGTDHSDASDRFNYTIQFHAWGPGIPAGSDIYGLNTGSRLDPGEDQLQCDAAIPPVRNGEAANLAADLLGLGQVPGSTIGNASGLTVTAPGPLPAIAITAPADNSEYWTDEMVLIEADASSAYGIDKVEFFLDQLKIGEDTISPWSFPVADLPLGTHTLTARAVDGSGFASADRIALIVNSTTADEASERVWDSRAVISPNPVNSSSLVHLYLTSPGRVEITIYDAAGRLKRRMVSGSLTEGRQTLTLDTRGFSAGVYFLRTSGAGWTGSGKFILLR